MSGLKVDLEVVMNELLGAVKPKPLSKLETKEKHPKSAKKAKRRKSIFFLITNKKN